MAPIRVLLCLLGLVVCSNSKCFFKELVWDNNPPTGCVDDAGAEHEFGSEWVEDCMDCSCTNEGLSCCSKMPDENADIPEDCELDLDKDNCFAKMVLKSDKTKECTIV
ncbi:beta-microseminoprotein-like [Eucyclogobius newberryi]|uniref:beta-microseminoprotein-like n=1 Tax=Eucyclogobius newberryi TaxID=166745 RepID=UPI003B5BFE71